MAVGGPASVISMLSKEWNHTEGEVAQLIRSASTWKRAKVCTKAFLK